MWSLITVWRSYALKGVWENNQHGELISILNDHRFALEGHIRWLRTKVRYLSG